MEHLENMLNLLGAFLVGFMLLDPFVFVELFGRFPFLKISRKINVFKALKKTFFTYNSHNINDIFHN